MQKILIIDGYNLLHRGFRFELQNLEDQRRLLQRRLREYLRARPGVHIVLVYDGAFTAPAALPEPPPGDEHLEVIFSRPPQAADDLVLSECRRRRGQGEITAVSSDFKDIISRLPPPVRGLSSEDFAARLDAQFEGAEEAEFSGAAEAEAGGDFDGEELENASEEDERKAAEKPTRVSEAELKEWLRIFSRDLPAGKRGKKHARRRTQDRHRRPGGT
jgi:predicted RNA-binding protein with PIN domain